MLVQQEAGARLSGVMGKGKGEAWAPAALFISHIVVLSRLIATLTRHEPAFREYMIGRDRQTRTPLVLFAQLR